MIISLSPFTPNTLGLATQVRPPCPASVRSFCTLRLNLVLTDGIPTAFRDGVRLSIPSSRHRVSPALNQATHVRAGGIHYPESDGTGPVVPVTGAGASGTAMDQFLCALFFHARPRNLTTHHFFYSARARNFQNKKRERHVSWSHLARPHQGVDSLPALIEKRRGSNLQHAR